MDAIKLLAIFLNIFFIFNATIEDVNRLLVILLIIINAIWT